MHTGNKAAAPRWLSESAESARVSCLPGGEAADPQGRPDMRTAPGVHWLGLQNIAVGVAHRDQGDQIVRNCPTPPRPAAMIRVDIANRLQGAELDLTIVLHPLSGRSDAAAFHLEAGRLCVLASRHRHTCIVVTRAGIADLLDAHPSDETIHLGIRAKFPDGREANHALLAHLANHRIPAQ